MPELIEASGQSKTPTLQNGDFVVADFDIEEFETAMFKNPQEANKLGLAWTLDEIERFLLQRIYPTIKFL